MEIIATYLLEAFKDIVSLVVKPSYPTIHPIDIQQIYHAIDLKYKLNSPIILGPNMTWSFESDQFTTHHLMNIKYTPTTCLPVDGTYINEVLREYRIPNPIRPIQRQICRHTTCKIQFLNPQPTYPTIHFTEASKPLHLIEDVSTYPTKLNPEINYLTKGFPTQLHLQPIILAIQFTEVNTTHKMNREKLYNLLVSPNLLDLIYIFS
ncbi:hypothetical protein DSO57_1016830 [Entomophthora muscae]|uniref:Uncharacterized protein n=1 Tax=Entomophthora muscae TaxID=34485 RepID=A0ACC2UED0_9FUNG|nr:hypothetical protein DSO57_1016830 [Entomophthora muscae]